MTSLQLFFALPIAALSIAALIHSTSYIKTSRARFLSFFIATFASMFAVVFSNSQITFLLAWEFMGLASAGLVAFENHEKHVKKATYIYLLACHAGAAFLMLAGILLLNPALALVAFFCALVGFGLKIGLPPFHVWLPEAHPAAPSPASAIMSGAMIPLGFFGLLNFFHDFFFASPSSVVGITLLVFGIIGAIGGLLFACAQTNLKKLLAFSSVENMGIISLALALMVLGSGTTNVRVFAFAGAIIHLLNHSFLKGALFLGAGAIQHQIGTLNLDKMGGLIKRAPITGSFFTLNAMSLSGLPPFNAFFGELLIFTSAFFAIKSANSSLIAAGFATILTLAIAGSLAVATYVKAIASAYLGEARSENAANASEAPFTMILAIGFLSCLSLCMIPGAFFLSRILTNGKSDAILLPAITISAIFVGLIISILLIRHFLLPRGKIKTRVTTWDCGYSKPTPRMAYTASAITQPLVDFFNFILHSRRNLTPFRGKASSPTSASLHIETDDRALAGFWKPLFSKIARICQRAHLLQNGSLHLYILLILLSVTALLIAALIS